MTPVETLHPGPRPLLEVERLAVRFGDDVRPLDAVDDVSLTIARGETVCLVGESGSGKTVTALSVLRLDEQRDARVIRGDIRFDGRGLLELTRPELERLRGARIAMVFQDAMTAFDPVFTIGEQIVETLRRHEKIGRRAAWERGVQLLERVQLADPRLRMTQIPQQLSGGMRQRAMIAMALACGPELLIADEPTTALDVTIQAQVLALLRALQAESGMAMLFITHDLGVAAQVADRVVVMVAGRVAETAPAATLFAQPAHPYTRGLLRSTVPIDSPRGSRLAAIAGGIPSLDDLPGGCRFHPRCPSADARCATEVPPWTARGAQGFACWHPDGASGAGAAARVVSVVPFARPSAVDASPRADAAEPLVEAVALSKSFGSGGLLGRGKVVRAVDAVSLAIAPGETLGLVGESGCGKSTLGRLLLQLETPTSGEVRFEGRALAGLGRAERARVRQRMQVVFQDPYGSIDPRWTVARVIAEPLVARGGMGAAAVRERVDELLGLVGLSPAVRDRTVHAFSGGQRQRIGIARAIALAPRFLLADEAVSALDLSVQAQILNLFADLRDRLALTTLFIGHGLNVVRHVSDRVGVMYLGRLVEIGPADEVFARPAHPYTAALVAAIPSATPPSGARRRIAIAATGELPSPTAPPGGCHFHPRCPAATARCRDEAPALATVAPGRAAACHFPL